MQWGLPVDASAHGPALDRHLILNLWIALALLVLAHLLLCLGLLLRRRREPRTNPFVLALLEYLPVTGLALLFALLGLRAEQLWAQMRYVGADPAALQVEATGMQFAWYFRYPGDDYRFGRTRPELISPAEGNPLGIDPADAGGKDDFVTSELVLPVGREVDVRLHAQDVIHGFAVPALRVKQNAVPGQDLHIHFTPTVRGTYAILCTQLCGAGHYRMTANLRVVSPEAFESWRAGHEAAQKAMP
jgi:cytochrome c oxidase subunit 2